MWKSVRPRLTGSDGRRRTAHIPDSDFILECDGIVTAINQDVDHQVYRTTHVEVAKNGKLDIGRFTSETGESGVFAGGDVSPWGVNVVIHAIADGKKAAMKIDQRRIVKKALPVSSGIYVYLHCVEAGGTRLSRHMDLYAAYHWYYMSGPGPLL